MNAYRSTVPVELDDRPRFSYQVLLTGLDFFSHCCRELGLSLDAEVRELKRCLIEVLTNESDEIARGKVRSEVDAVLEDIGTMIALSADSEQWLRVGRHYVVTDDFLLLDLPVVHALYKRYKTSMRDSVTIDSTAQFITLLKQEIYYDGTVILPDMGVNRPVTKLSLAKMDEKGMSVTLFTG
jgi:hypothetical protein